MNPRNFAFILLPGFSLLSLSAAIQPLGVANRLTGRTLYRWITISPHEGPVRANNGAVLLPDLPLAAASDYDAVVLVASQQMPGHDSRALARFLRRQARRNAAIGAVGTASIQLARLGLLDGFRTTLHWEAHEAFREEFSHIELREGLYDVDGERFTCAGGTAPLDMILHLIALEHGPSLAAGISSVLLHDYTRSPDEHQQTARYLNLEHRSPSLAAATRIMEQNIENPLSIPRIAGMTGATQRQLERLFRRHLSATPAQYYQTVRLHAARRLLVGSAMTMAEIAAASGFASGSHFSSAFRKHFGRSPTGERHAGSPDHGPDMPRS